MQNLARILVFSLALWLTTLVVGGNGPHGFWVKSINDDMAGAVFSFVVTAIIIAAINITIGKVVRFISIPLRLLTLGLFSLIINALLLLLASWVADLLGFGLKVDSFWWALLAALVLSIVNTVLNSVFGTKKR